MAMTARVGLAFVLLTLSSCKSSASSADAPADAGPAATGDCTAATKCTQLAGGTDEDTIQNAFATASAGWTLRFGEGTFSFKNQLTIGATGVSVVGAGIDKTILDFAGQASGSEGIFAQNGKDLRFEGFTVRDTKGNGIKVLAVTGLVFRSVKVTWTGPNPTAHGAYGLYPVQSENVLIEHCVASGASDSGLYIGQSKNVVVRNNEALQNVAGIEIENTFGADVYGNDAHDNTGGVLVFDLPELPQVGGNSVRVHDNKIHDNNTPNFAPAGNIVGQVPAGLGSLVMANHDIELFGNTFTNNRTSHIGVVSYMVVELPINDPKYYPYPAKVSIHDNTFAGGGAMPDKDTRLGQLLSFNQSEFPDKRIPDILYDGIVDDKIMTPPENPMQICVKQPGVHVGNLHLDKLDENASNLGKILVMDPPGFDCTLTPVPAVNLPGQGPVTP